MKYETTGKIYEERFAKRKTDYELQPPFPENCMVELTNACNHACVFCANPRMKRKVGRLTLETFQKFIREAASLGAKECGFYTTGEPFMTPNLHEFVRAATEAGIEYTYITTNGSLATPERFQQLIEAGLKSIKFSINAASRDAYRVVHGADDFDKVVANVRWLDAYRKEKGLKLRLLGSCVLTRATEHEKELHRSIFGPHFDDTLYVCAEAQAGMYIEEMLRVTPTYHRISYPPEGSLEPCFMLWKRVHLSSEGYLTLCCVDYEDQLTYARVDDGRPLLEHWHNAIITEMRRKHLNGQLKGTLCHKCLYGGTDPYHPISSLGRDADGGSADPKKAARLEDRVRSMAGPGPGPG